MLTHSRSPPSRSDSSATPSTASARSVGDLVGIEHDRLARHGAARRRCAPAPGRTNRSAHARRRYAGGVDTVIRKLCQTPARRCRHDRSTAPRWTSPQRRAPSGALTRRRGLVAPSFRSPPRLADVDRSLRRHPNGAVVSVRTAGRPWPAVVSDMIEGRRRHQRPAAAAGRSGAHRAVARRRLRGPAVAQGGLRWSCETCRAMATVDVDVVVVGPGPGWRGPRRAGWPPRASPSSASSVTSPVVSARTTGASRRR